MGYRHIDTAQMYRNERDVGQAIRESGVRLLENLAAGDINLSDADIGLLGRL